MMIRKLYLPSALLIGTLASCAEREHTNHGADLRRQALRGSGDNQTSGKLDEVQHANARVLKTLAAQRATAIGFVNEGMTKRLMAVPVSGQSQGIAGT